MAHKTKNYNPQNKADFKTKIPSQLDANLRPKGMKKGKGGGFGPQLTGQGMSGKRGFGPFKK